MAHIVDRAAAGDCQRAVVGDGVLAGGVGGCHIFRNANLDSCVFGDGNGLFGNARGYGVLAG